MGRARVVLFLAEAFYSIKHMKNLREKMEVQSLPVIYALSMETVPCMFLLGACFSLCLPVSFFFFFFKRK